MTTLRKAMPLLLICAALVCLPLAAQTQDCSFTYTFTGDATQTAVSNLSQNTPCINWRLTLSTDAAAGGTLSSTVTFETSPDNITFTAVPSTVCSSTVQPPCVLQGTNPIIGTQGMLYAASYGAYVRVVVTGSSGSGHGTIRGYGAKGASASAGSIGGGGGTQNLIFVTVDPVGACTVGVPNEQNTITGAQLACVGPAGPGNGTWALIIAANSSPLTYYYTDTASSIATYLQATLPTFSPKTTLTYAGLAIGTTAFQNWATDAGVPGLTELPAGVYTQHIHALKSAGGNVTLHTQFWEVSSVGVDIAMIGQTEESALLPGTETEFTLEYNDSNTYTLGSVNSRIVGRVFATVTGFAATIQVFVGGTADSKILLPGNGGGGSPSLDPGSIDCADASGSTTGYTCPTPSPIPTAYAAGMLVAFVPQSTNTSTTPTLDVAGLGTKNLVSNSGATLGIGQLVAGSTCLFEYNGTELRLTTCQIGGTGTVTHTGTLTANSIILGNGGADVKPGAVLPADATKFYNGAGAFTTPPAAAPPAASNLTPVTVSANTTGDQQLQEVALTAGFLNTVNAATIIHGSGRFTIAALQTPTLTFKAKLCTVSGCGSGTVVTLATITSGASLASSTNQGWNLQLMAGTSASGATGNLWVHGAPGLTVDIGALPGSAATPYTDTNTAVSANIDLTAALFVDFTVATSSGNAGNSITQDIAEVLPQGSGGGGGGGGTVAIPTITISSVPYGPLWSLPAPPTTGWSTDNLGSGSFDVTAGYPYLVFPTASSSLQLRVLYRNVPSTPYTVCQTFTHDITGVPPGTDQGNSCGYGTAWRDGTGQIIRFSVGEDQLVTQKWSASTSPSINNYKVANFNAQNWPEFLARNPQVFCQRDDGTNLTWYWSIDHGLHLLQFDQQARTDFFSAGPTQIGLVGFVFNADVNLALIGYKICAEPATSTCQ